MAGIASPPLNRGAAYYGLGIVTLLNLLNYVDRYILAAVLPRIQSELHLSNSQAGLLATAFLVAYFITSPFFGALGDRLSRPRLMSVGVVAWSLATAATGLMRNFAQLLMARSCVGVGEAAYATISPALLSDYFPRDQRGRAFSVFYVAIPVGAAAGYLLGGLIESAFGWRVAFYIVGLPGVAMALLALTAPDPPRGSSEETSAVQLKLTPAPVSSLFTNVAYLGAVSGLVAYTFALGGLQLWIPTFLSKVRGLDLARADYIVGVLTIVAGLTGTFVGGYAGDWLSTRVKSGQLWLCAVSSVAGVIPMWLALTVSSMPVYLTWFFIAEFFLFLSTGPINVVIVSAVPVGLRATAMAGSIFAIHLFGDAISPPIVGWLADRTSLAEAVMIMPVAIAVSGLIWVATTLAIRNST
jgi:MFS transporter, Spinster family, sphingosine-1-phosphate transporter